MKILTFDIEDWFHILDFEDTEDINAWNNYDSRLKKNVDFILNKLEKSGQSATFFILGWVAEKHPEIVKLIFDSGNEIGSHSFSHLLLYKYNKEKVKNDLEYSIKLLQDISGSKIKYFRAPGFSILNTTNWVFDVLLELGVETDSSIFPTSRAHGGYKGFPYSEPCKININGAIIKELPINTYKFFKQEIVFSGGGYYRLLPYFIQKRLYKKSDYLMTYFHPRDFDADQPVLENLSRVRKFKSYVGLKGSKKKFSKLLNDFDFVDLQTAVEMIDWNKVPEVKLLEKSREHGA
jgi:polysaccharide deacetylase family protein (PEP-CTERM system associated)